jgi:hypothetical protein
MFLQNGQVAQFGDRDVVLGALNEANNRAMAAAKAPVAKAPA